MGVVKISARSACRPSQNHLPAPLNDVCLLQHGDFRVLGKLVAMSIVQGGPGLPVMLPAAYAYMCREEEYLSKLDCKDVPDPLVATLLDRVSDGISHKDSKKLVPWFTLNHKKFSLFSLYSWREWSQWSLCRVCLRTVALSP